MNGRFYYEDKSGVTVIVKLSVDTNEALRLAAEAKGVGKQEIENLCNQLFQKFVDDLGLTESGGI